MTLAEPVRSRLRSLLRPDPRLTGLLGLLFVVAIALVSRPYRGVRHDALLYAAQTLNQLWPERFQHELFFMFGSQDRFSVFSKLFAVAVARVGLADAEIAGLLLCQFAFIVAVWKMAGQFTRSTRWLAVLCVVVFPHTYASRNIFGFAENFLTARSVAEPLVLFGFVAWSHRKHWLTAGLFVLAGLMHPLMVLPAAVVVWIMLLRTDRRWLWLLGMAVPILGLALANVAPFDGLLRRYDDDWWAQVHFVNGQTLLASWQLLDWTSLTMDVAILWLSARRGEGRLHELTTATLYAIGVLVLTALVTVDVLHDVLLTSLQLWRILWIGHLLALMCLPFVVLRYWRRGGPAGKLVAVATVAALLAVGANIDQAWILLAWLGAALYLQRHAASVSPSTWRLAIVATAATILIVTLVTIVATWRAVAGGDELSRSVAPIYAIFSLPVVALLLSAVLLVVVRACPTPVAVVLIGAVAAVGATHWDQRSSWQKYEESGESVEHPFDKVIPPTATVFWSENVEATWFVLKRPHYVAPEQGAGLLFRRDLAMEFGRRITTMTPLSVQRSLCKVVGEFSGGTQEDLEKCSPTPDILVDICHRPTHPDFMVFPIQLDHGVVDSWTFTGTSERRRTYYLYDCSRL